MPATPGPATFKDKLERGDFVFTGEVTPPLSSDPEELLALARPLRGLADAVNVTDAASARAQMGALAAAALIRSEGLEPILQLTCRDRNRIALQGDLIGAAALGVRNLLVLHGDTPAAGDQPDARAVFDLSSNALAETARLIRDEHRLPNGRKVGGRAAFFIGGADTPVEPGPDWSPQRLAAKRAAGIAFIQTQFCMDAGLLRRYMARLHAEGLIPGLRYLIGIAPLYSAKSARWMREKLPGTVIPDALVARIEKAADPPAEGQRICLELIAELATIPGVAGVHLMAPRNEPTIAAVIAAARALVSRAATF
ncbi:MAG: methylenetetrahydrofolate reductase [Xanthobacteraceae bacterium]|nr:MAG: methylenetetrahydrofolate reductase [Xanthobacteraceae bacterium]